MLIDFISDMPIGALEVPLNECAKNAMNSDELVCSINIVLTRDAGASSSNSIHLGVNSKEWMWIVQRVRKCNDFSPNTQLTLSVHFVGSEIDTESSKSTDVDWTQFEIYLNDIQLIDSNTFMLDLMSASWPNEKAMDRIQLEMETKKDKNLYFESIKTKIHDVINAFDHKHKENNGFTVKISDRSDDRNSGIMIMGLEFFYLNVRLKKFQLVLDDKVVDSFKCALKDVESEDFCTHQSVPNSKTKKKPRKNIIPNLYKTKFITLLKMYINKFKK